MGKLKTCKCVEDVCTRDARRILRNYIGRTLRVGLTIGKTYNLIGTLTKVNQGIIVLQVKGRPNFVPICEIDFFQPVNIVRIKRNFR